MKKLFASLLLLSSLSLSAKTIFLFPTWNFNPYQGECTIFNTSNRTVSCNVQTRGQTQKGMMLSSFDYMVLYQGMMGWTHVYNNNPNTDRIMYVNATAFCNAID